MGLKHSATCAFLSLFILLPAAKSAAQTTDAEILAHPEYTGGVHLNYPGPTGTQTKAPKGYKPFFINHVARHGSRYLVWEPHYTEPLSILRKADSANVLTSLGKDVLGRCEAIWEDAHDRIGELTPLGEQQHRGVAERMFRNYPEVFRKGSRIVARSTQVPRCILSMVAFSERLKELEPALQIDKTASGRDAMVIATTGKEYSEYNKSRKTPQNVSDFMKNHSHYERLVSALIADKAYADTAVNGRMLVDCLFATAYIQQDCPKPVELMDIFTDEEKMDLWQCGNLGSYLNCGPDLRSDGKNRYNQIGLLKDFIQTSDRAVRNGDIAAQLRFTHDSYIMPFTTTLMLSDCMNETDNPAEVYKVWSDFLVCPMCANIQMIFYRNRSGNVIVKFLHNENEVGIPAETNMYPYYKWEDVKAFYQKEYDLKLE